MGSFQLYTLCLLGILLYIFSVDPNVSIYLGLLQKFLATKFRENWYNLILNPGFPWVRYRFRKIAERNADLNARLLMKELGLPED